MTGRYHRIGEAMRAGKTLPPLELYELRERRSGEPRADDGEYYVVDGHHRVAMARRLGQDFLDAHVVVYQINGDQGGAATQPNSS
jgi:ParB-like chromosome segregation protein Spo0J